MPGPSGHKTLHCFQHGAHTSAAHGGMDLQDPRSLGCSPRSQETPRLSQAPTFPYAHYRLHSNCSPQRLREPLLASCVWAAAYSPRSAATPPALLLPASAGTSCHDDTIPQQSSAGTGQQPISPGILFHPGATPLPQQANKQGTEAKASPMLPLGHGHLYGSSSPPLLPTVPVPLPCTWSFHLLVLQQRERGGAGGTRR